MTGLVFEERRERWICDNFNVRCFQFIICHWHREFILVSNDFTEAKVLLLSCPRLETARPCDTLVTMR